MRKIFCVKCNKYLGEIRDARLLKEIKFLCPKCDTKRMSSELYQKMNKQTSFGSIFGGL